MALARTGRLPREIDAGIDGVEDAPNQNRPPRNLDAEFPGPWLDVVEREIGPRTGAVGAALDHGVSSSLSRRLHDSFYRVLIAAPDVDRDHLIRKAEFLGHDRDFPAVRRRRVMEVDHGVIRRGSAA